MAPDECHVTLNKKHIQSDFIVLVYRAPFGRLFIGINGMYFALIWLLSFGWLAGSPFDMKIDVHLYWILRVPDVHCELVNENLFRCADLLTQLKHSVG